MPHGTIPRRAPLAYARRLSAAAGALALGCVALTDPRLPDTAEAFLPPPAYGRWWGLVEECSGISRPLADVEFYQVPNVSTVPAGSKGEAAGYYSAASHRIVLAGRWVNSGFVVRHEMLHALLQRSGHPPEYYQDRCATVVDCSEVGCRDEGPPPATVPADAPLLPLADAELRVAVLPNPVARSGTDNTFSLVVRVTNPRATPVRVPLASTPDLPASWVRSYGFRIVPVGAPLPFTDLAQANRFGFVSSDTARRVPFAARQTRTWVIEVAAPWYPPGDYLAVGVYNTRQVWTPLTIVP